MLSLSRAEFELPTSKLEAQQGRSSRDRTERENMTGETDPLDLESMPERELMKRQNEEYWGCCWAVPLGRHMEAEVSSTRPNGDSHDIEFRIQQRDGTVNTSWGEITAGYINDDEPKWWWSKTPKDAGQAYHEPDAVIGAKARDCVERKRRKYCELVRQRGRGHLLVVLRSPLTSRGARIEAENAIQDVLETEPRPECDPFNTVWLGYWLPDTSPEEEEDPKYAFREAPNSERFNFFKCIWVRPDA